MQQICFMWTKIWSSGFNFHQNVKRNVNLTWVNKCFVSVNCLKNEKDIRISARISVEQIRWIFGDNEGIIVFISPLNICCGYLLESPCRGNSNEYPQHFFFMESWQKLSFSYHEIPTVSVLLELTELWNLMVVKCIRKLMFKCLDSEMFGRLVIIIGFMLCNSGLNESHNPSR